MADIALPSVDKQLQRRFKQQGNGLDRFRLDVVDGVNTAIRSINRGANLATRFSSVSSMVGTITNLDADYTDIVVDLATLYLMEQGQRPSKGYEQDVTRLRINMQYRIDEIRADLLNQVMDADDDNETQVVGVPLEDS